ncbi:hypothetical protein PHYPSEUDO_007937 [Phytophthora pseudosyringae]|uniref:Uncharacterized protein n=1 Tax=Phytophthora pseudosyringae TaxID=221518 RepID=A0A8T1WDP7_9STRA|nr:hypothetical protein PHYPSEUDO_007937 [Phytophthora pseudosyringae]
MEDDDLMAIAAAVDAASASEAETQMEEEDAYPNATEDAAANSSDDSEDQASSETDGADGVAANDEEMPNTADNAADGITDAHTGEDEESASDADESGDALDGRNPLVQGMVPTTKTFDRHVRALVRDPKINLYFDQWKRKLNQKTMVKRLRLAFEELLPRLMGARDYAGAAKVLDVMYHRFTVTPALCIEASLEILRRQPDYRDGLLRFYEAALSIERIDKILILKEMWLFHIVHGEFYEAYHLYQDKIQQMEEVEDDARLLANFGILCYWLMFIESKDLRDMLKREDMEYEEEEDDDLNSTVDSGYDVSESIESVIESNYLFKTPIGAHILYQHASNALRRAVALSPNSAMFMEYYVQLLVLVGDIQPACDYLEAFYQMNPGDPHGPRMLAGFLGCYYPDSVDAQVAVFSRWMKNDPSCSYPLEKMLELSSAGVVSSFVLTEVLIEALDTCGSDLYVAQNPEIALALWRNLAELLAAMDEEEFLLDQVNGGNADSSNQVTLVDIGAQHMWWKRVYFARPSTVKEVVAVSKRDNIFMEVSIYRAAVADRLFPGYLPLAEALRSAMDSPDVIFSHEHVRLFKSFFSAASSTPAANMAVPTPFSAMPFIRVIVDTGNNRKNPPLPIFKGSADTLHVIDRKSIVKREAAGEMTEVVVTRGGKTEDVDPHFVEELYEALESEVNYSSTTDTRSQRKRKADAISTSTPVLIPGFVGMVEEEVYNNPDATVRHIYSVIHQKLRRSNMLVPTAKIVAYCVDLFRRRLKKNLENYGHGGLMMRYDEFIAVCVRRQRDKGIFEVTKDTAKAAIGEMKRVLPSPHPHFPDEKLVEEAMRLKATMHVRQRRLRLLDLKKTLKPVLRRLVFVDDDRTFVDAVHSVCKQNGSLGVITRTDIARTVQNMLPMHYYGVLQRMKTRSLHLLTSRAFRKDCNTAEEIFKKLKQKNSPRTIEEVKVLLWVERYEALYGPIIDNESNEESKSDSGDSSGSSSDTSSDISSNSDSDGSSEETKGSNDSD